MAAITPGLGCLCETGIVDAEDSDGRGVSLVGELEDVAVVGSEATCMQAMRRMINTRWRSALMHSLSAILKFEKLRESFYYGNAIYINWKLC